MSGLPCTLALHVHLPGSAWAYPFALRRSAILVDGYLGVVEGGGDVRAQVDAVNIKRRAYYTDLAAKRGAKIEEVGATTACELFRTKVGPGQFYRGTDGAWRQRSGSAPVPLPDYCG